jgi:hypothetical protein
MDRKSNEAISLFVRDDQSGRLLFNAEALQALGINPVAAEQCGYPIKGQSPILAEAVEDVQASRHTYPL